MVLAKAKENPLTELPLRKGVSLFSAYGPSAIRQATCNGDDRRQWRKQGGAVGAAASRMRAAAKQTLGAATRAPYQDKIILSFANSPPLAIWNFASRSETCWFFFSSPETS